MKATWCCELPLEGSPGELCLCHVQVSCPNWKHFITLSLVIQKQWIFNLLLCNDEALGNTKSKVPKSGVMISSGTPGLQVEVGLLKGRLGLAVTRGGEQEIQQGAVMGLGGLQGTSAFELCHEYLFLTHQPFPAHLRVVAERCAMVFNWCDLGLNRFWAGGVSGVLCDPGAGFTRRGRGVCSALTPPPAPARVKGRWERAVPAGCLQAGVLSPGELSLQINSDRNTALLFRTWLSDEGKGSRGSQCGVSRRSCARAKGWHSSHCSNLGSHRDPACRHTRLYRLQSFSGLTIKSGV